MAKANTIPRQKSPDDDKIHVGGAFDPSVARLETSFDRMQKEIRGIKVDFHSHGDTAHTDFRLAVGCTIAVGIALASVIVYIFYW